MDFCNQFCCTLMAINTESSINTRRTNEIKTENETSNNKNPEEQTRCTSFKVTKEKSTIIYCSIVLHIKPLNTTKNSLNQEELILAKKSKRKRTYTKTM